MQRRHGWFSCGKTDKNKPENRLPSNDRWFLFVFAVNVYPYSPTYDRCFTLHALPDMAWS